jgi:peptidoglycan/xylan/chitin deacetylase (PgdA/CDA1 family)
MDRIPVGRPIDPAPVWPNGAKAAVSFTFDVDAECGWLGESDSYKRRLSTLTEGRFSVTRGVPRILEILASTGIHGTFYVPGDTADRHPDAVKAMINGGHEIAHHGYAHLRSDSVSEQSQREEIERGLEALGRHGISGAMGYRSPSWELTPETFEMLIEFGFLYDSSAMGDDRPYIETLGDRSILEIPVHWSLDDWPYFAWMVEAGGRLADPDMVRKLWLEEFRQACSESRMVTYTMHPEVIGRGYRIEMLRAVINQIKDSGDAWIATHSEVARIAVPAGS